LLRYSQLYCGGFFLKGGIGKMSVDTLTKDRVEKALTYGFKLLNTHDITGEYREEFIRNLEIMYSDHIVPDVKSFQSFGDLEFPLQAERFWFGDIGSKYDIICTFLGTEPYSSMFGELVVYVALDDDIYKYTYRVYRVVSKKHPHTVPTKFTHLHKERINALYLAVDSSMQFLHTNKYIMDTPDKDKEIADIVHSVIVGRNIAGELRRRESARKYKLYLSYRKNDGQMKTEES
jgi:hypothetical protein